MSTRGDEMQSTMEGLLFQRRNETLMKQEGGKAADTDINESQLI